MKKQSLLPSLSILMILGILITITLPCNAQTPGPIVVSKFTLDDDEDAWADDHSEGDGDKIAEQGEKIRMDVFLRNQGNATATNVQATISTESKLVTITNATRTYDDIQGGAEKSSAGIWRNGFHFTVAFDAASENVLFIVKINTSNAGSYTDSVKVSIKGGGTPGPITVSNFTIDDDEDSWASDKSEGDNDKIPEQGERIRLPITLNNIGTAPTFDVKATIKSSSTNIVLTDSSSDYGVLGDNKPKSNEGIWRDGFHFEVKSNAVEENVLFIVTITTRNTGTYCDSLTIHIKGGGVSGPIKLTSYKIDDDDNRWAQDMSQGDGDGVPEQGETIRMPITVKNEGSAPAFDVKATLSTNDTNITITKSLADYKVIGDGISENNEGLYRDGFHFKVNPDAQTETVIFKLEITTRNSGTFSDSFSVSIIGGGIVGPIEIKSFKIDDDNNQWAEDKSSGNGDGIINENEKIRLVVTLLNMGSATALDVQATLSTEEPLITINEPTKSFGSIGAGGSANNEGIWRGGYHFTVANSIPNKRVRFDLDIKAGAGKSFSDSIILSIGTKTDQAPPVITIKSPNELIKVPVRRFAVEIDFDDGLYGSGIDTSSLNITNDKKIGINSSIIPAGANFSQYFQKSEDSAHLIVPDELEFPAGQNTIKVRIADKTGNVGEAIRTFTTSYFGLLNAADGSYINISPYSLKGYAIEKYVNLIKVNGVPVSISNDQFFTDLKLSQGPNLIEVKAYDLSSSLIGTEQFTIIYDNIPPTVTIFEPINGSVQQYSPITVKGTASDQNPFKVLINNTEVKIQNNQFEREFEIVEGSNLIQITAIDSAYNRKDVTVTVIGIPPSSPTGKQQLYIKEKVLSKFPFEPYPPNTTGFYMSYVFETNTWTYLLDEDIQGNEYKFSLLAGCYGLGSANMVGELVIKKNGVETIIASTPEFVGNMAGPTPYGFFHPSRKDFSVAGIDPETGVGDTLLLRIKKTGGDRVGLIFIRDNNSYSWLSYGNMPQISDYDISGKIQYYSGNKNLNNVILNLENSMVYYDTTTSDGNFKFENIPAGNYALKPTKTGGQNNAVSAYDASMILRYTVNILNLNPQQLIAADVSGNGEATSYDASYILRYIVGLIDEFPVKKQWKFIPKSFSLNEHNWTSAPESLKYEPLNSDMTDQDFIGILYGDVSGNWTSTKLLAKEIESNGEQIVQIGFGEIKNSNDSTFILPIEVNNSSGIISGELEISLDEEQLEIIDVINTIKTADFQFIYNLKDAKLLLAFAGSKFIEADGPIFNLMIKRSLKKGFKNDAYLKLTTAVLNEGEFSINLDNSEINIKPMIPKEFALYQNYPNPFNSLTAINYQLPRDCHVTLKIFNGLGQEVATLVNEPKKAGYYSVSWDAMGQASGVYFVVLKAEEYKKICKMLLIR